MSTLRLTCPECHTALRMSARPEPGKKIRCPRCRTLFTESAAADRARPEDDDLDSEEEEERSRRRRPRRRRRTNTGLIVGLIAGGVGLLVLVGFGVAFWITSSRQAMLVGTWESTSHPTAITLEFKSDQTCTFRLNEMVVQTATYRLVDRNTLELKVSNPAGAALARQLRERTNPGGPPIDLPDSITITMKIVTLARDELVLETPRGTVERYKRSGS